MNKKIGFLYFIGSFLLTDLSLFAQQDTLVYKTGEKVAVRVDSVGKNAVFYKAPAGTEQFSESKSQIGYIKYEHREIEVINPPEIQQRADSVNKSFICAYAGVNLPLTAMYTNIENRSNYFISFSSCKNYGSLVEYVIPRSNFGLAVEFCYSYNSLNFNNFFSGDYLESTFALQNENSPYFKIYSLVAGGLWEITRGRFTFTTKLLAGCANFQSPDIQYSGYTYYDGAISNSSTQQSYEFMPQNSRIFSFDLGVSLNIKIVKRFYGFLTLDYLLYEGWINTYETVISTYTTVSSLGPGNSYVTTTTYTPSTQNNTYNYHVPPDFISGSIGIGYSLCK